MINCNVTRDILPLYAEDMVSEDTRELVEAHLESCESCRAELEQLRKPAKFAPDSDAAPLENLKKKLRTERIQTVVLTALLMLIAVVSAFAALSTPNYLPYDEAMVSIVESSNGKITVSFPSQVTNYSSSMVRDEEQGVDRYHIYAWNTALDRLLPFLQNKGRQNMIINSDGLPVQIFYAQNNSQEDIQIYGPALEDTGVMTLPRLSLLAYLMLAFAALGVMIVLRRLLRKNEKISLWLNRAIPLPLSYILAHFCVLAKLGPRAYSTYSLPRDFSLIVLVAVLFYCAILVGMSLYKSRKAKN